MIIDSHCHLTYEPMSNALNDTIKRATDEGVKYILTISTEDKSYNKILKIISEMVKEKIISKNYDFTQTLQKIINQNHKVKVVLLNEKWFEIDNIKDMVIAEDHFSNLKIR